MDKIEFAIVVSYLLMTCYFFINWLRFILSHPTSSPEDNFLSFVMFLISTIFWPIIFPMSCIEIFRTKKIEFSVVVPIIVVVSAFSLVFYMAQLFTLTAFLLIAPYTYNSNSSIIYILQDFEYNICNIFYLCLQSISIYFRYLLYIYPNDWLFV